MAKTVKQNQQIQDKEKQAYAFYVSRGWTPEQSIGIVGNLIRESNLNTTIVGTADDKKSQGLAQWHGDRLRTLKNKYGDKWTDFNSQLDFVDWELKNTEKAAGDKLKASKGVWQSAQSMSDHYERPKVKFAGDETRQRHVADIAMKFKGVKLTPEDMPYYGATYANSVQPYINQKQEIIIPTISNFDVSTNSPTFVPEETKTEVVENKNVQELQQKANEKSFLEDLYAEEQPQYGESQEEIQQQVPKTNFANVYNQVSQFIDEPIVAQQGMQFKKKPFQLQDERNLVQRDATQVNTQKFRPLNQLNVRNKTDKEIAAEREAKIQASVEAQKVPYTIENWRRQLAAETAATGDKLRVSNEPNFFDDYVNPAAMIGNMASNLGQAPLQAQQSDSILPYVAAIGAPLTVGALAGLGTQNTGQFVNNLANPLAGTEDLVNNLGNKYLPNAYKHNPWAFKADPKAYYRKIGNEGLDDLMDSGVLRSKPDGRFVQEQPYFSKGIPMDGGRAGKFSVPAMQKMKYPGKYMAETKGIPFNDVTGVTGQPINTIFKDTEGLNIYKEDWLQGYKQVEVPKTTPIRDLFIQPKQKFSDPSLSNIEEPYISKRVFNDGKEQEVFESAFPPEHQSKLIEERTKYYDKDGNEIPKPDRFLQQGGQQKFTENELAFLSEIAIKDNNIEIRPSKIEGQGVFTTKDLNKGDDIGLAHSNGQPSTQLGKFHNHSENPNAESIKIGENRFLKTLKKVRKGEEITVDYRKQPELEQPSNFKK